MNTEAVTLLSEALARAQAGETIAVVLVEVAPGADFPTIGTAVETSEGARAFVGLSVASERIRDTIPL